MWVLVGATEARTVEEEGGDVLLGRKGRMKRRDGLYQQRQGNHPARARARCLGAKCYVWR